MSQEQKTKTFCPQTKHSKCPIKFMCLNESCSNLRFFCLECIKEDKHAGHQKQIREIKSFSEYQIQTQNELSKFITEIQNHLLNTTNHLIQFFEGLQQKYIINFQEFNQLNVYEMNYALNQMIKMKSTLDQIEPQLQASIIILGEQAQNLYHDLDLSQLSYLKKPQVFQSRNEKIHRSEIINIPNMNSQITQCIETKIKPIDPNEYRKLILLGQLAVGKTKLFNQLKPKNIQNDSSKNQLFQSLAVDEYQYTVVDTPQFEMENDIDVREETIKNFSPFFYNNQTTISTLGIVVNYNYVDSMKKKIMEVYKYVRKLQSSIIILVVDWDKCENAQIESVTLNEKLSKFGHILFIRNDIKSDTLRKELNLVIRSIPEQKIQLHETIFENYGQ